MLIIKRNSPHLAGVLLRLMPAIDLEVIEQAFSISLQNGGFTEQDYVREFGVSFNPRPARIALILLQDAGLRNSCDIAAGMISSAWDTLAFECLHAIPDGIIELACRASLTHTILRSRLNNDFDLRAAVISSALFLDRARHIHLADESKWITFYNNSESALALAEIASPSLHVLLSAWRQRFARRLKLSESLEHSAKHPELPKTHD